MPGFVAFVMAALLGPVLIPLLRRLKAGQTVRDCGPESHLQKTGTPTMGGFIFLIPFFLVCAYVIGTAEEKFGAQKPLSALLISVGGFALIGFLDDYIKVVLKRSMGLRAWQKFLLQILLAGYLTWYLFNVCSVSTQMLIPFTNIPVEMGGFAPVLEMILILGTVNGSNFTDGLDGLASSVTAMIALFLLVAAASLHSGSFYASSAMVGALMGFLLYNSHKASVFMGDTGSLALGGYVSVACSLMGMQLFVPVVAFIYMAEVLSVMIQVSYFKLTKGKRIFRMAPIHHHFELGGWKETKVVAVFTIITAVLCMLSLFNMEM